MTLYSYTFSSHDIFEKIEIGSSPTSKFFLSLCLFLLLLFLLGGFLAFGNGRRKRFKLLEAERVNVVRLALCDHYIGHRKAVTSEVLGAFQIELSVYGFELLSNRAALLLKLGEIALVDEIITVKFGLHSLLHKTVYAHKATIAVIFSAFKLIYLIGDRFRRSFIVLMLIHGRFGLFKLCGKPFVAGKVITVA